MSSLLRIASADESAHDFGHEYRRRLINLEHDVARHEEAVTDDANQIALLKTEIAKLREQHEKEIEALQGHIKNLAKLVWCVIHRISVQSLIEGIDERHYEMV